MTAFLNLFSFNPPHDYCLILFSFSYRNMKGKHHTKLKKYFILNLDVYFTSLLSYRRKPFRSMGFNREDKSREFYSRTDH